MIFILYIKLIFSLKSIHYLCYKKGSPICPPFGCVGKIPTTRVTCKNRMLCSRISDCPTTTTLVQPFTATTIASEIVPRAQVLHIWGFPGFPERCFKIQIAVSNISNDVVHSSAGKNIPIVNYAKALLSCTATNNFFHANKLHPERIFSYKINLILVHHLWKYWEVFSNNVLLSWWSFEKASRNSSGLKESCSKFCPIPVGTSLPTAKRTTSWSMQCLISSGSSLALRLLSVHMTDVTMLGVHALHKSKAYVAFLNAPAPRMESCVCSKPSRLTWRF